jgi:hypothetical protein
MHCSPPAPSLLARGLSRVRAEKSAQMAATPHPVSPLRRLPAAGPPARQSPSCKGTWGGCLRAMQVPAHSMLARRLPRVCVGTGGGKPSPGVVRRLPVVVPPPSGACRQACRVSGQRKQVNDFGGAARGEAELTKRSAVSQLATARTAATRSLNNTGLELNVLYFLLLST